MAIRIRQSKKDRQHKGPKKKGNRTNNELRNITHKTKDRSTRIPLNTRGELRCFGRVTSSCSTSGTRRATFVYDDAIDFNINILFYVCQL